MIRNHPFALSEKYYEIPSECDYIVLIRQMIYNQFYLQDIMEAEWKGILFKRLKDSELLTVPE